MFGMFILPASKVGTSPAGEVQGKQDNWNTCCYFSLVETYSTAFVLVLCRTVFYEMLFYGELIHLEAHYATVISQCRVLCFVSEGILLTIHKTTPSVR